MIDNEKLIEEARAEAEATKNSYYTNAPLLFRLADALEAVEKAHTPTDDGEEDWDNRDDEVNGETRGFLSCGRCDWSMARGLFADLHEHERIHESEPQGAPTDERESLAQWLHMRFAWPHAPSERTPWPDLPEHLKDGWRDLAGDAPARIRSEGPEPSAEDQGPAASCHLCVGSGGHEGFDGEWVECSCQHPTQGEPSDEREALAFETIRKALHEKWIEYGVSANLAALDVLDALRAAGFHRSEEPEWEYRSHVVNDLKRHVLSDWTDEETALAIIGWEGGRPREAAWIERRRPAGEPERVPVKQEGAET